MGIVGFKGICEIGDRAGKWLRYKVFWVLGKVVWRLVFMDLEWDSKGFERGFL